MDTRNKTRRSGQALIEMAVCLVAFLIVIGFLVQVGLNGQARSETYMKATQEATEASARTSFTVDLLGSAEFIGEVQVGDDDSRYSADDGYTDGGTAGLHGDIVGISDPERLAAFAGPNRLSELYNDNPVRHFEMVRGYDSETVRTIPMVRNVMGNNESVEIENEVFMPWLRGLY